MATRLIFLDIDGVLNAHEFDPEVQCGQIHREKVGRLNRILRATDASIVLSSAWRYIVHRGEANLMGMEWLLRSHGVLANRLIGITGRDVELERASFEGKYPEDWPHTNERGRQITAWIIGEGWRHYGECGHHVVIDDMDLGISNEGHPFVQTDGAVGMTESDADRAIAILNDGGGLRDKEIVPASFASPLPPRRYLPWSEAGGPNECSHGYAAGIPCPDCDRAKVTEVSDGR